ncbi:MAG TPA: universal stress protein [Chitinophagaceae bacterium]|nr:universal stress protein [Chitinophagaceae bacterium]
MHTIIVPTDFSDTSKNAARFAVQVAAQVPDAQILLYNVFRRVLAGSDGSPLADEQDARKKIVLAALEHMKADLLAAASTTITCIAEEDGSFLDSLERLARHQKADIIIMGITGSTKLEQIFMGSNSLNMINRNVCPVMVVPPDATFKGVKNVLFATDMKEVDKSIPVKPLQSVINLFNPTVHVVNVDSDHYVEVTQEYKVERAKVEEILKDYKREFYFIRMFDFIDAISQFTKDKNIDVIITVPRKNSFLSSLFKTSHTEKLVYHSSVPLVAIHE